MSAKTLRKVANLYRRKLTSPYLRDSLQRIGAVSAVERILVNGRTENGDKLKITKWFKQQIRLTADNRLRHLLTTGASQISKSLVNYLVAIDDLVYGQINIGWIYASRQSMINQQPSQFQAMVKAWNLGDLRIDRNSVFRFKIGAATANFSYANSASQKVEGGAAEGKEQNSFQASKLYFEEKSSWKSNVDLTPRLGASRLISKPIRELGTPGAGTGIESQIKMAAHNFEPGIICPHCKQLSWLHPIGNLFKPKVTLEGSIEYFSLRGEILDFLGTEEQPFVACTHCNADITESIKDCELYSKQSLQSVDEFLDELPEGEVFYPSVSIYLSPLLKVPDDPYRLRDLVSEGLNPEVPLIFHQNKLGIESKFTKDGITNAEYREILAMSPWVIDKPVRIVGIDQGTDAHYLVELEIDRNQRTQKIICNSVTITEDKIITYLQRRQIDFALIDNEPGRKSANELCDDSGGILAMADQRNIMSDVSKIKVEYGGIEVDCYAISNTIFQEEIFNSFGDCNYRITGNPHRKFEKHICSVKRDLQTGEFLRPANHDDDFFYALMFAEAAATIYFKNFKPPSASNSVGTPLKQFSYGKAVYKANRPKNYSRHS